MSKKSEILVISHVDAFAYASTQEISDERRRPSAELLEAVETANGRARTHTTTAQEVVDVALRAELQLTMSNLGRFGGVGVEVDHRGKGPAAASYRGVALVTAFTLRRKAAGWVLVSAHTEGVYSKTPERFVIAINPAHANRICAAALKPFTVVDAVEKKKAA